MDNTVAFKKITDFFLGCEWQANDSLLGLKGVIFRFSGDMHMQSVL